MTGREIDLHIDELVLHGFPPGDRQAIADALRGELIRLFAEHGVPPALAAGGEMPHADGGTFNMRSGEGAGSVGARIAAAVHGGLNR